MAQKSLGYVQLVWTCPNCLTKNPGNYRFCKNCGASMPENVKFEQPIKEEIITDQALIDEAKKALMFFAGIVAAAIQPLPRPVQPAGQILTKGRNAPPGPFIRPPISLTTTLFVAMCAEWKTTSAI